MICTRSLAWSSFLTLVIASLCMAQATKPADLDGLIAKLGAADFHERDAAEARIVEMGDEAVKAIEALAEKTDSPEVKSRAASILKQIERTSLTQPTRVTLKYKNAPAREVYASLFKQADAKVELWPSHLFDERGGRDIPAVTVDLDKVPFWNAMRKLQEQTGLAFQDMGRELNLAEAHGRPEGDESVCITGPFMVVADENSGPMIHQLKVFIEPRIRVLGHVREPNIAQALDINGEPIPQPAEQRVPRPNRKEFDSIGGNVFDLTLSNPVPRVGLIRGTVRILVQTAEQTIEIDAVAKANNVTKIVGGHRIMLNAMNVDPGEWFITLVLYNANRDGKPMPRIEPYLTDERGRLLTQQGYGSSGSGQRVSLHMDFKQGPHCGPPAKLTVNLPAASQEIEIPFEFGGKVAEPEKVRP
jgi:hypothetical protein